MVELGTRLAIERARTVTLHLKLARWSSIPTQSACGVDYVGIASTARHSKEPLHAAFCQYPHNVIGVRDHLFRFSKSSSWGSLWGSGNVVVAVPVARPRQKE
jgi:hypothetical protein